MSFTSRRCLGAAAAGVAGRELLPTALRTALAATDTGNQGGGLQARQHLVFFIQENRSFD